MRILVSGVCGFVGSTIVHSLLDRAPALRVIGVDNFSRPGSHVNREPLQKRGVKLLHGDVRAWSDLEALPEVDWIIDSAANASVLAGIDGATSSRQLVEHNLYGTVNLLELAKRWRAGFILLSTSRVYSIKELAAVAVVVENDAFQPTGNANFPNGLSGRGIAESFSTAAPISLYGSSKLASECMALEYGDAFGFPVWINRCGVLAGAGQFGRPDQGIFAFWINAYLRRRPLKYIGFGGNGFQARDCFHPRDLAPLLERQMIEATSGKPRVLNFGGGLENTMSLAQLSAWCASRFGPHEVSSDPAERAFDLPWIVLDSARAAETWQWKPETQLATILEEIAGHAEANPGWLELSAAL